MKISHAQVEMSSHHRLQQQRDLQESLQLHRLRGNAVQTQTLEASDTTLSERARSLADRVQRQEAGLGKHFDATPATAAEHPPLAAMPSPGAPPEATPSPLSAITKDGQLLLMKAVIEQITGKRLTLFEHPRLRPEREAQIETEAPPAPPEAPRRPAPAAGLFGMSYTRLERFEESELTRFSARAQVTTADGRQLALNLELAMSRHFVSESRLEITAGVQLKDPLVINLGEGPARLSNERIRFDLDADGQTEVLPFFGPGSGLLALDRDGNGTIDHGGELFGALSGNGFADLVPLDEDGNGFIDEADSAFVDLRIWVRQDGEDRLLALADQGVGALYLGYADTPFDLRDEANQLQGRIRATGVYLREDGSAGTLQQVDLVV